MDDDRPTADLSTAHEIVISSITYPPGCVKVFPLKPRCVGLPGTL